MAAHAGRRTRATAGAGGATLLGVVCTAWLLWVAVKPTLAGVNSDAAVYLLLADWLSPWHPTDIDFGARLFEHYPFPPLYPLLMAALGIGSATPALAYGLNALLQAAAAVAAACWARRAGCGAAGATLAAASLVLTPIALFTAMGVFSEPLYLVLSMSALAVLAGPRPQARHWYVAAGLLGAAALTRGAGLTAVAALLICWGARTRLAHARLTPLLAMAPPLAWMAVKGLMHWNGSYTHNLFGHGVAPVLLSLAAQVPTNLHALAYHFVRCFDFLGGGHSKIIVGLLLVPAALTMLRRLRDFELDAWYGALYLGLIAVWPYPNHFARFLLVVLPLFCAYALVGVAATAHRFANGAWAPRAATLALVMLALVVAPSVLQVAQSIARATDDQARIATRISSWYGHDSLAAARRSTAFSLRVLEAMKQLGQAVPRDACVSSTMAETFMLHARRYSRPPPSQRDDEASLRAALGACPYVLLLGATAFPAVDFPAYYPAARVPGALRALRSVARDEAAPDAPALAILTRYAATARRAADD